MTEAELHTVIGGLTKVVYEDNPRDHSLASIARIWGNASTVEIEAIAKYEAELAAATQQLAR